MQFKVKFFLIIVCINRFPFVYSRQTMTRDLAERKIAGHLQTDCEKYT